MRLLAELETAFTVLKVFRGHAVERRSKLTESLEYRAAVGRTGANEEVEVVGGARPSVDAKGIAANQKILDPIPIEDADQVLKVFWKHSC